MANRLTNIRTCRGAVAKPSWPRVAPVAVGVVVAIVFGAWEFTTRHSATPDVVEGWAMPNAHGTAISLHDSNDTRAGDGYIVTGASWAGRDGLWHDGADGPTCIGTDTATKTRVRWASWMWSPARKGTAGRVWCGCAASHRPHQPRSAQASFAHDQPQNARPCR
ncbi:hypothetical protein G7043_40195 [Lentzea sp. NEAU-D13]|uniref:Uncharacterized protein n=1 Tax=Lentzea alba TaxID=2714351 RepID=A0A7C9RYE6_9PSEU|nr:hypothetical protein [Lentzea alba]NGY65146.1 hypothetical protein [Lentzea alba]